MVFERSEESVLRDDVDELLEDLRRVLVRSGRVKFTAEEKQKVPAVMRVLIS